MAPISDLSKEVAIENTFNYYKLHRLCKGFKKIGQWEVCFLELHFSTLGKEVQPGKVPIWQEKSFGGSRWNLHIKVDIFYEFWEES